MTAEETAIIRQELVKLRDSCKQVLGGVTMLKGDYLKLREALVKIADWELPATEHLCDDGSPMSYEAAFGSWGAKAYIRNVAREALGFDLV